MTNSSPERNLSRLGASRLVVRAGAILCQRRGAITPQDQGQGPFSGRAPEGRGVWAFPFPYNDDFFNWHKWDEILPKHLTTEAIKAVFLAEEHLSDEQSTTTALWAARDAWIKKHGGLLPVRRFWWEGDVWARFDRRGTTLFGPGGQGLGWELLNCEEYLRAARHAEPYRSWSRDHMEIFLALGRGRIVRRGA